MQTPSGHCRCKKTQTPSRHEPKTAQTASQKTVSRYPWNPHKTIFGATEHMPSLCKHHLDTADAKRPKHHLDTSRKPPKPQAKKLFHVTFGIHIKQSLEPQSTSPAYANTSLCKHHLDTADAKRPKHHLDTSRKPPKPQAKKLFHVTFGIHIKQSLEPQSTCPAYANTIWNHIKQLWSHRAHAQPMQTPSGHCRCKKSQTPSRHEPKTAQTASQKTVSHYLWNPHKTIFGATEHMPSLCKHHLDTADAKRPKHHLDTSRKPPKPQAKKNNLWSHITCPAYANTIWNHIKQLWSHRAHAQPMQTPSGHCRCKKTQTPSRHEPKTAQTASQKTVSRYLWTPHKTIFGATEHMPSLCKHHLDTADAKRPKHHLDTSRKPPKPQAKKLFHVTFGIHIKQSLEPQSTCPANASTIWTLQMQKDPNTI